MEYQYDTLATRAKRRWICNFVGHKWTNHPSTPWAICARCLAYRPR